MAPYFKFFLVALSVVNGACAVAPESKPDVCPAGAPEFTAIEKKAQAGDAAAQTALASCYDLGRHVQPNGKESIRWLTEAANHGYTPAEYELGRIYLYGRGIPVDYAKALLWERRAAEQGDARSQRDLAFMYERGFGVPADPAQAAKWNRKAAAQGQADAQLELARSAAQRPDCSEAIRQYKEAADHGQELAPYELGKLYLSAKCGANRALALLWFTIGARLGSEASETEASRLAQALSARQKKRADAAAEKWIRDHPALEKDKENESD